VAARGAAAAAARGGSVGGVVGVAVLAVDAEAQLAVTTMTRRGCCRPRHLAIGAARRDAAIRILLCCCWFWEVERWRLLLFVVRLCVPQRGGDA
jgi:hypothetical protein